jgi:hypothetical protein
MEKQKGMPAKAPNTENQTHGSVPMAPLTGPATLMNKNSIFGPLTPEILRETRQFEYKKTRPSNFEHNQYALV